MVELKINSAFEIFTNLWWLNNLKQKNFKANNITMIPEKCITYEMDNGGSFK